MTTVLVLGFGPFPGAPVNPSADLARALGRRRRPALSGTRIAKAVLPTSYAAAAHELPALLAHHDPDLVLLFGLAGRSKFIRIESRAVNRASILHPDAARKTPDRTTLFSTAPAEIPVRAPVRRLLAAARAAGVAAALSRDAGRYLCNAALFTCLETARRNGRPRRVAFVHIPPPRARRPVAIGKSAGPSGKAMVNAAEAILLALLADVRQG